MSVELKVPELGESVTEVYIGEWHKSEGDRVAEDEELVELESEKATFDAPSPAAGVLQKILKQSGDTAQVGEVIAYIEESAEAEEGGKAKRQRAGKKAKEKAAVSKSAEKERKEAPAVEEPAPEQRDEDGRPGGTRVAPAARRLLEQYGLSPQEVDATGPGGRLLKQDVQRFIKEKDLSREEEEETGARKRRAGGEPGRQTETVPMSPVRRRIAQRLVEAQQNAALLTTFNEIDMSAVNALRREHREAFQEKYEIRLGFMSFFVKAAVDALRQFPQLNAQVRGTDIVYHNYCDVGIAIGSEKGLVVPVLRNAERMSFAEIEQAIDDFARRAREGRLSIEELQGGTFTISNGGIYGSLLSTPIVNPPQSGVLGMHAIQERPVVRNGEIVVRPMMYVALSYDHRIVDGREAVTFLRRIRDVLEEPARMLLEI